MSKLLTKFAAIVTGSGAAVVLTAGVAWAGAQPQMSFSSWSTNSYAPSRLRRHRRWLRIGDTGGGVLERHLRGAARQPGRS